jgi:hypothetical protein
LPKLPRLIDCAMCNSRFVITHSQTIYCSDSCKQLGLRASWNKYAITNRQARRQYHRALYAADPARVIERTKTYQQTEAGKIAARNSRRTQLARHRDRIRARDAVHGALRAGRLKRLPCEVCGSPKSEAHHDDYSKPLCVRWLCRPHHRQADAERRLIQDGEVVSVDGVEQPQLAEKKAS